MDGIQCQHVIMIKQTLNLLMFDLERLPGSVHNTNAVVKIGEAIDELQ